VDFGDGPRLAGIGLKSATQIGAGGCLHQFADFGFQELVRHDQRPDRSPHVPTARSDSLINSCLKLLRIRLRMGRRAVEHGIPAMCPHDMRPCFVVNDRCHD